jgi:DNA modification methylase
MMPYMDFLNSKIEIATHSGFEINPFEISPILKPHQRDAVQWAIRGGRRALFESFGLGKTIQQLEICRIITTRESGKALIVCPLGVKQEFTRDAGKLLGFNVTYIRNRAESTAAAETIHITNYERVRDGDIDPDDYTVVCLDEAGAIRDYGSKTYQTYVPKCKRVKYRFVSTATPAPNKYKELIHYAGFLGIMDTGQALTRFFQRDSTQANNLTLYPHKEQEFWLWMSSWALFLTKPSDLGYSDEGYDLPPMKIIYHCVDVDHGTALHDRDGQTKMFRDAALGLKEAAREKRDSMRARIFKVREIVEAAPDDHYVIWHDLEAERHALKEAIPGVVDVYGSQDMDIREQRIIDFSEGRIKYLATKPSISGQGCNFQRHCHKAIFTGIGYEFNDFIQAIHRIVRFLQAHECEIHIIYAASEGEILKALQKKWRQYDHLMEQMRKIIREYGLATTCIYEKMQRSIGVERREEKGRFYMAIHNDCTIETARMPDNSVHLIHTSIPFSNHYEYTPSYNDFGHNENNARFWEQMDYLTPELHRVLVPGRIAAIHVKDRILYGNATGTGMPTLEPFHAEAITHYLKHGFHLIGMITVSTDVVRENNQTYRLTQKEMRKDGSKMGVGCPEYILLLRKSPSDTSNAYSDIPVVKTAEEYPLAQWQIDAHGFWRSSGDRLLTADEFAAMDIDKARRYFRQQDSKLIYDYEMHVEIAKRMEAAGRLPKTFMAIDPVSKSEWVWDDVVRMRTHNSRQTQKKLHNHICPLQLDIVERIINRYTNPDEVVYDPFGGIMTVPYMAVKMGRRGVACELNPEYYRDGLQYLREVDSNRTAPTLFDLLIA